MVLMVDGRITSNEAPMRHLLVRFWHVSHKKHITCLSAKKLALWTKLSHFLHKYALSEWQYNEAFNPQSSQDIELVLDFVSHIEAFSLGGKLLHELWFFSSIVPLHILRDFVINLAYSFVLRKLLCMSHLIYRKFWGLKFEPHNMIRAIWSNTCGQE
jgi:hypothetical protein